MPKTTLTLAEDYGDAVAFANPVGLGNASGWTFLSGKSFFIAFSSLSHPLVFLSFHHSCALSHTDVWNLGPEDIKHVAERNCNNYRERFLPDSYSFATNGKGILATGGRYNKRHRSLCQPSFQKASLLSTFADMITEASSDLKRQWDSTLRAEAEAEGAEGGVEIDAALQMQRLTLDIIGKVAFSHNFGQVALCGKEMRGENTEEESTLVHAVNRFGEALAEVFVTPMPVLKALELVGYPSITKLRQSLATIHSEMRTIIEGRIDQYENGTNATDDLLDSLMQARDENGNALTTEELFEDVHDIMGAGHETTATTLSAALFSVARNKHVADRIRKELDEMLEGGRPPAFEDLESLKYTEMCCKEVLRLYPSIPIFPRVAKDEDCLPSGYLVPEGEVVFMSSYAMGRLGRLWDDPLKFDPERFAPEKERERHKYAFVPFGAGPRMCLGWKFGQMSLTLVLATLLQDYTFEVISPTADLLDIDYDITMNFHNHKNGIRLKVFKNS